MMVAFPIRMTLKQAKWETQKAKGEKRKFKQHEDGVFFFFVRLSRLNKTQNLVRRLRQQDTSAFFLKRPKTIKETRGGKKNTLRKQKFK